MLQQPGFLIMLLKGNCKVIINPNCYFPGEEIEIRKPLRKISAAEHVKGAEVVCLSVTHWLFNPEEHQHMLPDTQPPQRTSPAKCCFSKCVGKICPQDRDT